MWNVAKKKKGASPHNWMLLSLLFIVAKTTVCHFVMVTTGFRNLTQKHLDEHRWIPEWDLTLPLRLVEASLTMGDTIRRRITAASRRTLSLTTRGCAMWGQERADRGQVGKWVISSKWEQCEEQENFLHLFGKLRLYYNQTSGEHDLRWYWWV